MCQSPKHIPPSPFWGFACLGSGPTLSWCCWWPWGELLQTALMVGLSGDCPSPGAGLSLFYPAMAPLIHSLTPTCGVMPQPTLSLVSGRCLMSRVGAVPGCPPTVLLPGWGGGTAMTPRPRNQPAHWVLLHDSSIQTGLVPVNPSLSTSTWAYSTHTCVPMQFYVVVTFSLFWIMHWITTLESAKSSFSLPTSFSLLLSPLHF